MAYSKYNVIKVALMLLVFVGQVTIASALPCKMEMQKQSQSTTMDHSSHMMTKQIDKNSKNSLNDCCSKNSNCSMSGCISLAVIGHSFESNNNVTSESIERPVLLSISKIPTSLYRPPILS